MWDLGIPRLDIWAALAPVGGVRLTDAPSVPPSMPIWCFRGQAADIGPPAHVAKAPSDGRIKVTSYDTRALGDVVEFAYAEPDLPIWLLRHSRGGQS
jgi:hypothetical protein